MASIVYLTSRAPAKLTDDLIPAGHRAWECLSVSEVLYICEYQWIDVVVIAPDVEDPDVVETHLRHFTIRLSRKPLHRICSGSCRGFSRLALPLSNERLKTRSSAGRALL
jgi:hypothetical protein